jgi:hypothetical protein
MPTHVAAGSNMERPCGDAENLMRKAISSGKPTKSLHAAVAALRDLNLAREAAIRDAFDTLEVHHAALARLVVQQIGDRHRAARWMYMRHRAFAGRSAYELLIEGDEDAVWDSLLGEEDAPPSTLTADAAT